MKLKDLAADDFFIILDGSKSSPLYRKIEIRAGEKVKWFGSEVLFLTLGGYEAKEICWGEVTIDENTEVVKIELPEPVKKELLC